MTREKAISGVAAYLQKTYPLPSEKAVDIAEKAVNMAEALCHISDPPKAPFSDRKTMAEFAPKQRKLLFGDEYDAFDGFYGHFVNGQYGYKIYVGWDEKVRTPQISKRVCTGHMLDNLRALCFSRRGQAIQLDDLFYHVPKSTRNLMTTHKYFTVEAHEGVIGLDLTTDLEPATDLEFGHSSSVRHKSNGACVSMEAMNDLKSILTEEVHVAINKGLWIFSRWIGVYLPEEK